MSHIAFFDVDKTIINGYSGFYTTLSLIKHGVIKKRRIPAAIFYRIFGPLVHANGLENVKKMYQIAAGDMAGYHIKEILKIGQECFDKKIRHRIYEDAIQKIQEHKQQKHPVYLITSGPYMLVRILAEFLGVDGFYSAGPVINKKGILKKEVGLPLYYREGKVIAAQEVILKHKARWEDCYYYADSIDDIFLMEKVGHPNLVNPDGKLLKIGREKGWSVLRFTQTLSKTSSLTPSR